MNDDFDNAHDDKAIHAKLTTAVCVDCGQPAEHLHGNRFGLEPCCGHHGDDEREERGR